MDDELLAAKGALRCPVPTKNRICRQTARYGIFSELGSPGAIPKRQSLDTERPNLNRLGQPNRGAIDGHGRHAAEPKVDDAKQGSPLAEPSEFERNLAEREKGQHGLKGYASRLCKCNGFNMYGVFSSDRNSRSLLRRGQRGFHALSKTRPALHPQASYYGLIRPARACPKRVVSSI